MEALATPATPIHAHELADAVVQREWDAMLHRLTEVCELCDAAYRVDRTRHAWFTIARTEDLDLAKVERVLFQNLLLAPFNITQYEDKVCFGGTWLWQWRKAVPWRVEPIGAMSLLAPGAQRNQWIFRYNHLEVEG